MKTTNSSINIFFVNSSFQLVSAILLSQKHESFVFCFKKQNYDAAKEYGLRNVHLLNYRESSSFSRKLSTKQNIKEIFSIIKEKDPNTINFHLTSIASTRYNYFISSSRRNFPLKKISFNIIPDGTLNLMVHPLSESKKERVNKRGKSLFDKVLGLKYTPFTKDRYGMLSDKVSKIYTIPGTSKSLPKRKLESLPPFKTEFSLVSKKTNKKTALIIGQPLTNWGIINKKQSETINKNLTNFVKSKGVNDVLFVPHPTNRSEKKIEFFSEEFNLYSGSLPIELLMMKNQYDYIIGFSSTALITAKLIYGNAPSVVSIGSELFNYSNHPMLKTITSHFEEIGVLNIPLSHG